MTLPRTLRGETTAVAPLAVIPPPRQSLSWVPPAIAGDLTGRTWLDALVDADDDADAAAGVFGGSR